VVRQAGQSVPRAVAGGQVGPVRPASCSSATKASAS
jgi:hypothetical protein